MKNTLLTLILATSSLLSFAQMTKSDIELALAASPVDNDGKIFLNNNRTFYTDGSSKIAQTTYFNAKATVSLTETSLVLKYYSDDSKTTLSSTTIIPFTSMEQFAATPSFMIISFNGR